MASSASASLSNSKNSRSNFSFSTQFMNSSPSSFTNLLSSNNKDMDNVSWGLYDHGNNDRIGLDPNYKSFQPFSPPPVSPSSYFASHPGLNPTEFLDSPVLFPTSNGLASPTTGAFAGQTFNWRSDSNDNQQGVIGEEKKYSDFSFPTQTRPPATSSSFFQSSSNSVTVEKPLKRKQEEWNFDQLKQTDFSSDQKTGVKSEFAPDQSFSSEGVPLQANVRSVNTAAQPSFNQYNQSAHYMRENKRRSSSQLVQPSGGASSEISDQSVPPIESSMMQEDSSISLGEDEFDQSSSMNSGDEDNVNEPDVKRWRGQNENENVLGAGSRTNQGSFEYSGFGKQNGTYMNQTQYSDGVFPRAKEEPRNDSFFDSFLN
ncbi:WRKY TRANSCRIPTION FACTOR WRKY24-LIKE [Salix koriyanagi]|uniref:WRKY TRANSCRIPTION FACTOR WRKY24-LIKE n=1 Tax=Salix koriyanagi TaxID=2511006 RepID=A0A9Q0X3F8_9ROSI|nr:WRKY TRANSCRIPTION FACTOR WRKY24-LIKE [Salix koriyanagi]